MWGERDSIIPLSHGHATHEQVPGSRLELFAESGHFPQLDEPERFIDVLVDFMDSTKPAALDAARQARACARRVPHRPDRARLDGTADLALQSRKVETAGIEPTSVTASEWLLRAYPAL